MFDRFGTQYKVHLSIAYRPRGAGIVFRVRRLITEVVGVFAINSCVVGSAVDKPPVRLRATSYIKNFSAHLREHFRHVAPDRTRLHIEKPA